MRVADRIDIAAIHKRLGWGWGKPRPFGEDSWWIDHTAQMRILISLDDRTDPGVDWIHASISHRDTRIMPSYNDLKRLHAGVFGTGFAYQVFVPPEEHIDIRSNVLHLWGRLDGAPVLPDFGQMGTI